MERLTEAELRVMEVLWQAGELPAGQIAARLKEDIGWSRNTTYTLIKRCVDKGVIARREPGFVCRPLVGREAVQRMEADALVNRLFEGSRDLLFAAMLGGRKLTDQEAERLHAMIDGVGREDAP